MSGGLAIAILSAGRASRFGGGKLDADCAGKPLGRWALDAAGTLVDAEIALVVGSQAPVFALDAQVIWNPSFADGLGTSVAAAARWASAGAARALLVMLADMPLVSAETLRQLATGSLPAAVRYPNGRRGVPACFPAAMFGRMARLEGDEGAGPLLAEQRSLRMVETSPDELRDVDRPEDLADVAAILSAR